MTGVPIAVLSTPTANAHASLLDDITKPIKEVNTKVENIVNSVNSVVNWFKNLNEKISEMSVDLLVSSYELITSVVLFTPAFLFDSEWFRNSTLTFTGLSVALSMLILLYEGFQKMFGHLWNSSRTTDMLRVVKRMPLVVIGSAIAPSAFYYGFKGLNHITDVIIDMGKIKMTEGINKLEFNEVTMLELVAFIGFDLALIGMMIPVFLQNFRRWADLLMLGVMTPLALSCWVFKEHEGLFRNWWTNIKRASLTQLVYAVFLLIIGTLIFGTKTPDTPMDLLIKLGIVIGGLWRMQTPPNLVRGHIDNGADIADVWNGAGKAVSPQKKHKFISEGIGIVKKKIPFLNKGGKN